MYNAHYVLNYAIFIFFPVKKGDSPFKFAGLGFLPQRSWSNRHSERKPR